MGREETRSAVMERGATALTIRGRAWPFWGWGGFGRQGGGGDRWTRESFKSKRSLGKGEMCRRLKPLSSSPISQLTYTYTYTYTSAIPYC